MKSKENCPQNNTKCTLKKEYIFLPKALNGPLVMCFHFLMYLLRSMNNIHILHILTLHQKATHGDYKQGAQKLPFMPLVIVEC